MKLVYQIIEVKKSDESLVKATLETVEEAVQALKEIESETGIDHDIIERELIDKKEAS